MKEERRYWNSGTGQTAKTDVEERLSLPLATDGLRVKSNTGELRT
jgi:hypothetical protein